MICYSLEGTEELDDKSGGGGQVYVDVATVNLRTNYQVVELWPSNFFETECPFGAGESIGVTGMFFVGLAVGMLVLVIVLVVHKCRHRQAALNAEQEVYINM